MLKTVEISRAAKTKGCAVTYRAGDQSVFDTCPKSCSLNPSGCGSNMPDLVYMASVLNAKPRAGESMTYTHFHPKWYKALLGPTKTVINFSADSFQQAVRWIKRGQPAVSIVDESFWRESKSYRSGEFNGTTLVRCPAEYLDNFSCIDCGDGKPLCARGDRDYPVIFSGHGAGKRAAGQLDELGGCYAAYHNVRRQWEATKESEQQLSDSEQLDQFMGQLSPRAVIRHHIAGDMGRSKKPK